MPRKQSQLSYDRIKFDSILSSNKSATADFLNPPPGKSPYGGHTQKAGVQAKANQKPQKEDFFFKLSDAIVYLKRQGFAIDGTNISYYSSIFSAFVNCYQDPVGDFVHIFEKDLEIIAD